MMMGRQLGSTMCMEGMVVVEGMRDIAAVDVGMGMGMGMDMEGGCLEGFQVGSRAETVGEEGVVVGMEGVVEEVGVVAEKAMSRGSAWFESGMEEHLLPYSPIECFVIYFQSRVGLCLYRKTHSSLIWRTHILSLRANALVYILDLLNQLKPVTQGR